MEEIQTIIKLSPGRPSRPVDLGAIYAQVDYRIVMALAKAAAKRGQNKRIVLERALARELGLNLELRAPLPHGRDAEPVTLEGVW